MKKNENPFFKGKYIEKYKGVNVIRSNFYKEKHTFTEILANVIEEGLPDDEDILKIIYLSKKLCSQ